MTDSHNEYRSGKYYSEQLFFTAKKNSPSVTKTVKVTEFYRLGVNGPG
jgi:hypothetical protein